MDVSAEPRFTRRDYLQLPEGFPAELIEGALVKEPAPTAWHQDVALQFAGRLLDAVPDRGRVLVGPVDIPIDEWSVLQPDALVLREDDAVSPSRPRQERPPLLVAEVLSASTARRDRDVKTRLYLSAGVAEVWLVDPQTGAIEIHTSEGVRRLGPGEEAASLAVPGFAVRGADLVAERP